MIDAKRLLHEIREESRLCDMDSINEPVQLKPGQQPPESDTYKHLPHPKIGCVALIPIGDQTPYYPFQYYGVQCAKGRGKILPGGKWNKDETYHQAASRESFEEVGVLLGMEELTYLWHGPDGFGYETFTFLSRPRPFVSHYSNEGMAIPVTEEDLMKSSFAHYYKCLFDIIRRRRIR